MMPSSPSVFSARSKQMPMTPQYESNYAASGGASPRQSLQHAHPSMPQTQQAQRWATSAQSYQQSPRHQQTHSSLQQQLQQQQQQLDQQLQQQQRGGLSSYRQPAASTVASSRVSGDFVVTDLTDPDVAASAPPPSAGAQRAPYDRAPPVDESRPPPQAPSLPEASQPARSDPAAPVESDPAFLQSLHLAPELVVAAAAPPPEPAAAPPPPPQPIDPKDAALGAGVFAKVRMTHGRDGQLVAVKTYNHKEAREERAVAKHMLNEERLAGKLQHANIIAPQRAFKGNGCTELEMEYAPGGTLEGFVKKLGRPMTEDEARKLFRELVDAVRYLHEEKGICHRDIKMENVVLDGDGRARLVDFGAAKEGGADSFLTSMQGTPAYMAPELAQLRAHKGGPADVWALGVLLYNLLSGGAFPFWGKSMDELKRNITASLPKLPPNLSPSCKDLLTRLLQKSSAIRLSAGDILRHPWTAMPDPPGASDLPALPPSAGHGAGASHGGGGAGAADRPAHARQHGGDAAVAADAAAAAHAYRRPAAHGGAAPVHHQHPQQQRAAGAGGAPAMSPRTGHAQNAANGMYLNAGYQQYARNPITGGPSAGVDSRPSSPGGSKLAGLMNGDRARPGTACSMGSRASSAAQLNAYRRR